MEPLKNNETVKNNQPVINKSVEIGKRNASFKEDFSVATILVVASTIETIVQIVLIVNCYRSLISATSSPNWLWILFISWIFTSLLVTLLSIIWTFRGMEFEGRVCGQLLCYLMHLCLLGLVWRYLKITLAYEKADVEEFYKLRKLQIFMQVFPLLAIHFSYVINSTAQDNCSWFMIAGELLSSIISLSLFQWLQLKKNESHNHNHKPQLTSCGNGAGVEINLRISKILLLIGRVIIVGLLVSLPSYYPMLVIVAHLLTNFMWTCLTTIIFNVQIQTSTTSNKCNAKNKVDVDSPQWMNHDQSSVRLYNSDSSSWEKNDVGRHVKNSLVSSYALFWDVTVKLNSSGGGNSGLNFWCVSLPVILVLVENTGVLIFHLKQCQTTILFVVLSGTCFSVGILLFILMTTWNNWEIFLPSRNKSLKELPAIQNMHEIQDGRIEKSTQFLTNTVTLDFENCSEVIIDEKNEGRRMMMTYKDNLGTENPQSISNEGEESGVNTFNQGTSEGTNTYNYDRINESLITAVKMEEMDHLTFCNIPQNTMSSTSSRNTNTISNLTLQNSPELQKSKVKPAHASNSSPLVIRKASKIQLNLQKRQSQSNVMVKYQSHPHPHHSIPIEKNVRSNTSRCLVDNCPLPQSDNAIYEKLIEDAYGILICEGEESTKLQNPRNSENLVKLDTLGSNNGAHSTSATAVFSKKLRILCAKCLGNHDPLLSNCCIEFDGKPKIQLTNQTNLVRLNNKLGSNKQMLVCIPRPFDSPKMCSETTEYPTDTEFTCNLYEDEDEKSDSSHFSTLQRVTYVNVPIPQIQSQSSMPVTPKIVGSGFLNNTLIPSSSATLFPSAEVRKEFTGMEYVKAWLLMNDVTAKNMLNIRSNSLNRENGNRHTNKVCSKSKHILKSRLHSHSTLANPYRKSQPVFVLQPPPMQKQHPNFKNCCSTITNNSSISHCHHSVKQDAISKRNANLYTTKMSSCTVSCNQFQYAPPALKTFNELQNDLIETVV